MLWAIAVWSLVAPGVGCLSAVSVVTMDIKCRAIRWSQVGAMNSVYPYKHISGTDPDFGNEQISAIG
jgi:hypothetical protein